MNFCSNCGSELNKDSNFCHKCGNNLQQNLKSDLPPSYGDDNDRFQSQEVNYNGGGKKVVQPNAPTLNESENGSSSGLIGSIDNNNNNGPFVTYDDRNDNQNDDEIDEGKKEESSCCSSTSEESEASDESGTTKIKDFGWGVKRFRSIVICTWCFVIGAVCCALVPWCNYPADICAFSLITINFVPLISSRKKRIRGFIFESTCITFASLAGGVGCSVNFLDSVFHVFCDMDTFGNSNI